MTQPVLAAASGLFATEQGCAHGAVECEAFVACLAPTHARAVEFCAASEVGAARNWRRLRYAAAVHSLAHRLLRAGPRRRS